MLRSLPWLFATLVLLVGSPASAQLRVVATLPDLAAIASAVGGEHVRVDVIAASSEDPHYVDPRPSHLVKLNRADVLLLNGLGLEEGWLPPLQTQARNRAIQVGGSGYIDASTLVSNLLETDRVVDRAMGDVHPGGNPHFGFDPRAARDVATGVAAALARLDSANAPQFESNLAAFVAELDSLIRAQAERFAALPEHRRKVVCYHASLGYLLDWLGLEQATTVEPVPGVPPDPRRVADVVRTMRDASVPALVQEEFYQSTASRRIADLAGADFVVISGATDFEAGQRYTDHIAAIADALFEAVAP